MRVGSGVALWVRALILIVIVSGSFEAQACRLFNLDLPNGVIEEPRQIILRNEVMSLYDSFANSLTNGDAEMGMFSVRFFVNKRTRELLVSRWTFEDDGEPHQNIRDALVKENGWASEDVVGGKIYMTLSFEIDGAPRVEAFLADGLASINPGKNGKPTQYGAVLVDSNHEVVSILGEQLYQLQKIVVLKDVDFVFNFKWDENGKVTPRTFGIDEMKVMAP